MFIFDFGWLGTFIFLLIVFTFPVLLVRDIIRAIIREFRENKPRRKELSRIHDEVLRVMEEKGITLVNFYPEVDRIYRLDLDNAILEMKKALDRVNKM